MILLLGGTTESDAIAGALTVAGLSVMVSTVTDYPLHLREHPLIQRRVGPLSHEQLCRLIQEYGFQAIVDATHPYAREIGKLTSEVARMARIPYFRYLRPQSSLSDTAIYVDGHEDASRMVCEKGMPVLLTIGTKNLAIYIRYAQHTHVPVIARVLNQQASIEACRQLGIPDSRIIAARGPFSVDENIAHIRRFGIAVMVTKDSGEAGGVPQKLTAAAKTNCTLIMVRRPQRIDDKVYESVDVLLSAIIRAV